MLERMRSFHVLAHWAGIAALLALTVPIYAAGLNDTGITTCSNDTQNGLPCPVEGFLGQDAEYGSNGFDFTKLDAAGNELPVDAIDHICVRDNVTHLIWQIKISDLTFTFDETAGYVNNVNATGLCGFNDWRMPDPKELMGIADHSRSKPAIDTNYFPNTPNKLFWSGSPNVNGTSFAWSVNFNYGNAANYKQSDNNRIRLVRGKQSLDAFVDNNDGTITQTNTGLMWAKCSEGQSGINCTGTAIKMNWSTALTTANNSNLGGYSDWRLPNIKELQKLVDYNRYLPAIDTNYFPNTPSSNSSWFWSGSPDANHSGYAWDIAFYDGYTDDYEQNNNDHVRLVRSGKSFASFQLTISKSGAGSGSITSSDNQINCGATCSINFNSDSSVILTATANANSVFTGWSGACTNKTGDCTVKMSDAQTVTANFNLLPSYKLSISKSGNGSVTSSPAGISCGTACSKQFNSGTAITLTAKADTGSIFSQWTGCISLAAKPLQCTIKLISNKTVTAVFGTADIKITAMTLTPTSPAANSTFSAKITVKNQSTVTVNSGYLDVWANQPTVQKCGASSDKWIEIGSLTAGATKTLTVNLPAKDAGTKTLRVFVDSWCQTPESNEANNQLTKSYTVK